MVAPPDICCMLSSLSAMSSSSDPVSSLREWYPLESSPEVFTKMARSWGVPEQYTFVDVLGFEPELLAMVHRPVHAVIFLFPDTEDIVKMRAAEGPCMDVSPGSEVVWIPQVDVGHSCGTFAVIHALGVTGLAPKLAPFYEKCRGVEASERTTLFASEPLIYDAHHSAITAGQTIVRDSDWDDCDHFLSFVHADINGEKRLLEMDGTSLRKGPLDRGRTADGDLLDDVGKVVRELYLPRSGGNLHFSMIALTG